MESGESITRIITGIAREGIRSKLPEAEARKANNIFTAAGFHLRVARFGLDTYSRLLYMDIDPCEMLHESQQFVALGCEHMICGGLTSCLDLCAATVCRVSGLHPIQGRSADYEASVNLFGSNEKLKASLGSGKVEKPLADWLYSLRGNHRWKLLRDWRDPTTHGWIQRNYTITPGAAVLPLPSIEVEINGRAYDLYELSKMLFEFTTREFRDFVKALELALA